MSHDTEIQTYSGRWFDFENLEQNKIEIVDIAHSLSMQARWTGHTIIPFSVGLHSLVGCWEARKLEYTKFEQFEVLLHDAAEAFMVDVSRPLKRSVPPYGVLLKKVEASVAHYFGLPVIMTEKCRIIDDRMLITEYIQLVNRFGEESFHPTMKNFYVPPFDIDLLQYEDWTSKRIEDAFLNEYHALRNELFLTSRLSDHF